MQQTETRYILPSVPISLRLLHHQLPFHLLPISIHLHKIYARCYTAHVYLFGELAGDVVIRLLENGTTDYVTHPNRSLLYLLVCIEADVEPAAIRVRVKVEVRKIIDIIDAVGL